MYSPVLLFAYTLFVYCSVCDELFDELLEDMAREMLSGLEQCVNQLFDTEFHNPT